MTRWRSGSGMLSALSTLALFVPGGPVHAQSTRAPAITETVRVYRLSNEIAILNELRDFLAIPNVASDRVNIGANADHLVNLLEQRGITAERWDVEGSAPAVYGELQAPGATRTVVWYAHFDGQPVDESQWRSVPWQPVLRDAPLEAGGRELPWDTLKIERDPEWRIYARSASDDKSPIIAMLTALDALDAAGIEPSVNLKFFFEGEEEAGSAHLETFLLRYRERLAADVWLFCDGPVHQTRQPLLAFGARGVMGLGVTVYGPTRVLHSGHYGNWAPNPAVTLSQLIVSMRDDDGRVLIDRFYDDVVPLTAAERRIVRALPDVESELRRELGLGRVEGDGAPLLERIALPALNVRGLAAGNVGGAARNAIPNVARASIDFRLVPNQTPRRVRDLVEQHVQEQGFHIEYADPSVETLRSNPRVARLDWDLGYSAARTPLNSPIARAIRRIVAEASEGFVITLPMLGGSLPLSRFEEVLQVPLIIVPMVNHDNNQHAANENLRIQNLWEGIERYAALMVQLGPEWEREREP